MSWNFHGLSQFSKHVTKISLSFVSQHGKSGNCYLELYTDWFTKRKNIAISLFSYWLFGFCCYVSHEKLLSTSWNSTNFEKLSRENFLSRNLQFFVNCNSYIFVTLIKYHKQMQFQEEKVCFNSRLQSDRA